MHARLQAAVYKYILHVLENKKQVIDDVTEPRNIYTREPLWALSVHLMMSYASTNIHFSQALMHVNISSWLSNGGH
jgi:hypothetical protein